MPLIHYANTKGLDGEYDPGKNFDNPQTSFSEHFSIGDNSTQYNNYREHLPEIIAAMKKQEKDCQDIEEP